MVRKHFRYHRGDGIWTTGATYVPWDSYVMLFYKQWPNGKLEWTHDE